MFIYPSGQCWCARELFSTPDPLMRSVEPCCASGHLLSCVNVDVDPESLLASDDISINGVTLQFANLIPPHARVYRTDRGDEAVISYDPNTGAIFGSLKTEDGRSFALEKCGNSYIFEEFDMHSFGNDESGRRSSASAPLTRTAATPATGVRC